jgi:HEAT repeat protein
LAESEPQRVYAYVTCGDNQWNLDSLPVDSPATVKAIFEFLAKTFQMKRVYWRGEQDRLWLQNYKFRPESPLYYDWWTNWSRHLVDKVKVNDIAVAAARRHRMQIYIMTDLFDHGAQPDAGGMFPFSPEDRLRIAHPQWCPLDRWGERRATGPLEFSYPEVRQALLSRYLHHATKYDYDGIFLYTYVENWGARYRDEFGFNAPIVNEFKRRYGVDIRTEPFDKEAWYRLRGKYLTQFLRELHTALAAKGKKLSIAIYSPTPNYPEPWDGSHADIPAAGMIYLDWEGWVQEGIVDELFVWWRGDQKTLLDRMRKVCRDKPVELTVATGQPFDAGWKPFVEAGITPVSVWAPGYGLDRVSTAPSVTEALKNPDWRLRMQALSDVVTGRLKTDAATVAAAASDPHVLVRRQAMFALGALRAATYVPLLEAGLMDRESSVRIGAAFALGEVYRPESAQRLLAALLRDDQFQMKMACVRALAAMKEQAEPVLSEGIQSSSHAVREVCVRALGANGLPGSQQTLLSVLKSEESEPILFHAIEGLAKHTTPEATEALLGALHDQRSAVQMWSAAALQERASSFSAEEAQEALTALEPLLRQFGDGCMRLDAAWGWRVVGNTLFALGQAGKDVLEAMRTQKQDRWLAWVAYEVLYVRQIADKVVLCEEKEAVEIHAKYAPPFPGWRG